MFWKNYFMKIHCVSDYKDAMQIQIYFQSAIYFSYVFLAQFFSSRFSLFAVYFSSFFLDQFFSFRLHFSIHLRVLVICIEFMFNVSIFSIYRLLIWWQFENFIMSIVWVKCTFSHEIFLDLYIQINAIPTFGITHFILYYIWIVYGIWVQEKAVLINSLDTASQALSNCCTRT